MSYVERRGRGSPLRCLPIHGDAGRVAGIPDPPGDRDDVGRVRVAVGVIEVAAATEVLARPGVVGRDDVPGGSPARQQVEALQPVGQVDRVVVGRVLRRDQADVARDRRECRQLSEGVGAPRHVEGVECTQVFAQPQPFAEEERREQPALGGLDEAPEALELGLRPAVGVRPHGREVDALKEDAQLDAHRETSANRLTAAPSPRLSRRVLPTRGDRKTPTSAEAGQNGAGQLVEVVAQHGGPDPDAVDDIGARDQDPRQPLGVADVARATAAGPHGVLVQSRDAFGAGLPGPVEGDLEFEDHAVVGGMSRASLSDSVERPSRGASTSTTSAPIPEWAEKTGS